MATKELPIQEITAWVNRMMGRTILTEAQLAKILHESRRAYQMGGMEAVFDYLLQVTKADMDRSSLRRFAKQVHEDPRKSLAGFQRAARSQKR